MALAILAVLLQVHTHPIPFGLSLSKPGSNRRILSPYRLSPVLSLTKGQAQDERECKELEQKML
jgi:hypothetical protein